SAGASPFWLQILLLILLYFLEFHSPNLQRQSEEGDEAGSVLVVVHVAGLEGGQGLVVQAVGGGGSRLDNVALVQLHLYFSGDILLGGFHKCLDGFPERSKPFSFVDYLSQLAAEFFLGLHGFTV